MAATVRVALVLATVANPVSSTTATSNVTNGSGPTVRVADVTASVVSSTAQVRIADVTASSGGSSGTTATVRISDVEAVSVQASYAWSVDKWVPTTPTGAVLSQTAATSAVTGSTSVVGASISSATSAKSAVSGTVSFTAAVTVPVGVTTTDSGIKNPTPGDASATISTTATVTVSLTGSASVGPPGAGSLTVTADTVNSPPRILLTLVGALGPNVTIVRVDDSGAKTPVRLANPGTLNGGGWVGYDYEAPFGVKVFYQATASQLITSDPVTLNVAAPWLIHPGIPDLSQPLHIVSVGDETTTTTQSVQYALGRRNPVVQTDGVRHAPTFDLTVATSGSRDRDALDALLGGASVLLLQITYPDTQESDYKWVSVGDVTRSRLIQFYGEPRRMWSLPCTETDAPSGLLQAQRTWADVVAEFPTWQDVINTYATWADVITDNRLTD